MIRIITITVSDTRTPENDESGRVLREELLPWLQLRRARLVAAAAATLRARELGGQACDLRLEEDVAFHHLQRRLSV